MRHFMFSRTLLAAAAGVLMVVVCVAMLSVPARVSAGETTAQPPSVKAVCFVSNDRVSCVNRIDAQATGVLTDQLRALVQSLVSGPLLFERVMGVQSALPAGSALIDLSASDGQVVIDLTLPDAFLSSLTAAQVEDVNEQFRTTLLPLDLKRIDVTARDSAGTFKPLSAFLPPLVQPHKDGSPVAISHSPLVGQPPIDGQPQGHGALSGKTVFVSAGHGWYWYTTGSYYNTQRPVYPTTPYPAGQGIIEDFNNAEAVDQYLLPYLWNSGADAWTVRERDMNTSMLIVDDSSSGFSAQGAWTTGAGGYANSYHAATTSASATATATWTFAPPTTGTYAVYVWYPYPASLTRVADAHYFIDHAGGTTPLTVTQVRDGSDWRFVGSYPFLGGQAASVRLNNQSSTPGVTALADAVRIGGGVGDVSVQGAPPSGKPRWEEQAMQYAKWVGVPNVDTLNDVIVRPIFSEWEKEAGEDAVYISWHTNGYNGYNTTIRGTTSYIHSFQPTLNSDVLQSYIHTQLLNDIHAGWDPGWPDRGELSADLGELRLLSTMPGVLIENGFHDNPIDVQSMKDPRFNQLSARAIYHGLVRYWNHLDPANVPLVFLPEPPTHLAVRNRGAGQIALTWQPGPTDGQNVLGDAATSYRVYVSADGIGWRDGINVAQTTYTLTGLALNQLIYVRVTGVNAGGESFPTPVLAARAAASGVAPILIVAGFDRLDQAMTVPQYDAPVGTDMRVFVNRMNRYDYSVQHAGVITQPFDSVQHAVVSDGQIGLGNYTVIDWLAGEEQTPDVALNASDQSQLTSFLNNGGGLFLSGAEVGSDLVTHGQGPAFYANQLHAAFLLDNGDVNHVYQVSASAGGVFNGLGASAFDDGTHGTYTVNYPDSFSPLSGASTALVYNTGGPAAIQYRAGSCGGLVYLGVPFETIYPDTTRGAMMAQIMGYLGRCLPMDLATTINSPLDGSYVNNVPPFNGGANNNATVVQISIRRVADSLFYNGTIFSGVTETWLMANGAGTWTYSLPPLADGSYALRARSIAAGPITDTTPAAITFTLDTIPPSVPTLITPTNGISIVAVSPTFQWTGGGNPSGFAVLLDGVTTTLSSSALTASLPVTDGLHAWQVRAFDLAGNVSNWSGIGTFNSSSFKAYLPLIANNYTAPTEPPVTTTCSNLIVNGGFEAGALSGWVMPSYTPSPGTLTGTVNSGLYAARVGASATGDIVTGYSSIQQAVTIPANALTATLAFARFPYSADTSGDLQYVAILNGGLVSDYLVYERSNAQAWLPAQFDLRPYAGQTINVRFSVSNDGQHEATGLYVDDVVVQVCVP